MRTLAAVLGAIAGAPLCFAAAVLPQPEPQFAGKIAVNVKDSVAAWPQPPHAPEGAPNIVVILLDDTGFGDSSTFGGAAQTPQLDKLAAQGLRYNRFHVSATCSPTRAALLSGRNGHRAGFGIVVNWARGFPGYNGIWRKDTVPVGEVLRRNGYSTAAFGKWHNTPLWEVSPVGPFDRWPTSLGFDYFYGFMSGEDSQWEPTLFRNTLAIESADKDQHLTTALTDEAIRWLRTHASLAPAKPYFLYFATGATHVPHHVPGEWIEKYRGRFDRGWDQLRAETFARQKKLGVIPANAQLTARPKDLPAWSSLSSDERRLLARQMEIYAAFLAHTDHEIGRLLDAIREGPNGENTLTFYIVGDNGAGGIGLRGHDDYYADVLNLYDPPAVQQRLPHIDELGTRRFRNAYARAWAWAGNTPFQSMKGDASHFGGTRVPLVVSWPARIKDRGGVRSQFTDVSDIAATIYEASAVQFPAVVDGVKQQALDGTSFVYSFDHASQPSRHRTQVFEHAGSRAIYEDGWLASAAHSVRDAQQWKLYDIDEDFSQAHDLAARYPEKLHQLQALFESEARRNNIYPLGMAGLNQPWPIHGRREVVYYPPLERLPSDFVVPDFSQSHRITAHVVIPPSGARGVIVTAGSRYAGFALYVKDDRLVYENHSWDENRDVITSQQALPRGEAMLAYEFTADATTPKVDRWGVAIASGRGRLFINGRLVGEGDQGPITSRVYASMGATFGIGRAFASPVSHVFEPPFEFTGTLSKVQVELK